MLKAFEIYNSYCNRVVNALSSNLGWIDVCVEARLLLCRDITYAVGTMLYDMYTLDPTRQCKVDGMDLLYMYNVLVDEDVIPESPLHDWLSTLEAWGKNNDESVSLMYNVNSARLITLWNEVEVLHSAYVDAISSKGGGVEDA